MPWNPNTHCLTWPFTKLGKDGQGDLQLALSRTGVFSHVQLVGDVDQNGDRVHAINPCALWKSFQSPTAIFHSAAERRAALRAVNGGFSQYGSASPMPTFTSRSWDKDAHAVWTYYPPVYGQHPLRAMDFAPGKYEGMDVGYRQNAPSPVGVIWPTFAMNRTSFYAVIQVGNASYGSGCGTWDRYNCLSFDDVFPSNGPYSNYHFALLIKRGTFVSMVISPATVANVEQSSLAGSAPVSWNASDTAVTSGMRLGDTIDCCVCLVQYSGEVPPTGVVVSDILMPSTAVSLEIQEGSDRASVEVVGAGSIENMVLTDAAIAATQQSTSDMNGYVRYKIDSIEFKAGPGTGWNNITSVAGRIRIDLNGGILKHGGSGYIVGSTQIYGDASDPYYLAIPSGSQAAVHSYIYGNTIGNNAVPFDLYAYVPTTAGSLTLTLTVSFEYDTTKTVTASVTLTPQ